MPIRQGHTSRGSVPPFDVSPVEAEVPQGATQTLTVRFSASHAGDNFFSLLEVSVPNQKGAHLLMLRGRAWPCAGFVLSPQQQLLTPEALLSVPQQDLLAFPSAASGTGDAASPIEIELSPSGESGVGSAVITIGHIKGSKADAKPSGAPSAGRTRIVVFALARTRGAWGGVRRGAWVDLGATRRVG